MRGLIHVDNRCATNSVLQCLHATDELKAALDGARPDADDQGSVPGALKLAFLNMDSEEQAAPYDPKPLVEALSKKYSDMWHEAQLDAGDVFRCVLNALADDKDPGCKDAADLWAIPKRHTAACSKCNSEDVSYDAGINVNVYLSGKPKDLQDYVNGYSESFSASDAHCDKCKTLTTLTMTTDITELPKMLCFTVMRARSRVENGEWLIAKNTTAFDAPEELDCSRMSAGAPLPKYELYGLITHTGSCLSGHYDAFVKKMSRWYHVDDEIVTLCPESPLSYPDTRSNLYILMYRQVDSSRCCA